MRRRRRRGRVAGPGEHAAQEAHRADGRPGPRAPGRGPVADHAPRLEERLGPQPLQPVRGARVGAGGHRQPALDRVDAGRGPGPAGRDAAGGAAGLLTSARKREEEAAAAAEARPPESPERRRRRRRRRRPEHGTEHGDRPGRGRRVFGRRRRLLRIFPARRLHRGHPQQEDEEGGRGGGQAARPGRAASRRRRERGE